MIPGAAFVSCFSLTVLCSLFVSAQEVFDIKATVPKSRWHLGGRTLSTHAPSQRLRFQHVNHVDTSIASMVLGLSSKDWIHKSYAHLRKLDRTSTKPNSSTVFWSLFSLIKPHGCYTLPRLILNRMYIYSI